MSRKYFIYDYVNDQVLGTNLEAKDVEKLIGLKSHHVATSCDKKGITKGQYMIFDDKESYPVDLHGLEIHDRLVKRQIKNIKDNLRSKIEAAYRNEISGSKYYNKYYVLTSDGLPSKIFDTPQEIADYMKIPLGTAKSRMFRAGTFTFKGTPEICTMSDYKKIKMHYF